MSEKNRIALVGAAGKVAAPCHLNALAQAEPVELVALCDLDQGRLQDLAKQHSVDRVFTCYDQLLNDSGIDSVDLVVPPFLHAEMAVKAAAAGKNVYVEKPMARSVGEARSMIAAAEEANVTLMVGESYWFHGPHSLGSRLIDEGEIGEMCQVRQTKAPWLFTPEENERLKGQGHDVAWRFDPDQSGGGDFPWIMDHGPHLFATARRLSGGRQIDTVMALPRAQGYGPEAHLRGITSMSWIFSDGTVDGVWTQNETDPAAQRYVGFRTEVVGTRGTLLVFGEGGGSAPGFAQVPPVRIYRDGKVLDYDLDEGPDRSWQSNNSYYDQAHVRTLSEFGAAVLEGRAPAYSGYDGLHDLTATLAVIQSAQTGQAVQLGDVADDWRAAWRA